MTSLRTEKRPRRLTLVKKKVQLCRACTDRQQTPVRFEADVLVAGVGLSGTAAALATARNGVQTILFDPNNAPGGNATFGCVRAINNLFLDLINVIPWYSLYQRCWACSLVSVLLTALPSGSLLR